jgi:hypothetical protein
MLISGTRQGLAIEVSEPRDNETNFITFYDTDREEPWGRIEGEREGEYENNADYRFDQSSLNYDIYDAGFDVAFSLYDLAASFTQVTMASTSSTGCVGLGTCVTLPIPSWIVGSTAQSIAAALQVLAAGAGGIIALRNKNTYNDNKDTYQGVTYASGAGDYAEYLLRENSDETMTYGDVVGLVGGKISKNTEHAERMMVVSYKPIVLGNMPKLNREKDYEKVAFMGQVPVKVFGAVNIGDYILPSGKNDGVGIAIPPQKISLDKISKIVGIAWENNEKMFGLNYVNVAVGINKNDNNIIISQLENKIESQASEIRELKNRINDILVSLAKIENAQSANITVANDEIHTELSRSYQVVETTDQDVVYFQITREDFEKGLVMAEDIIRKSGEYDRYKEHLEKLKSDMVFKDKFFNKLQKDLEGRFHYHKDIDHKAKH